MAEINSSVDKSGVCFQVFVLSDVVSHLDNKDVKYDYFAFLIYCSTKELCLGPVGSRDVFQSLLQCNR